MSVVSCNEIHEGRGGELAYDQSRRWTRKFRVVTDDDKDGPATVILSPDLPTVGSTYQTDNESDSLAVLKSLTPEPGDDPRVWTVTATYDTKADASAQSGGGSGSPGQGGASPQSRPENPLDRPIEWRVSYARAKKAVFVDNDGNDIKNSAGYFYNPPYERDVVLAQFSATKNYASVTFADTLNYYGKINSAVWHGLAAKTVKIDNIDMQSAYENGYSYVRLVWTFLYDPDGWNPTRILDRGPYYLNGGAKTYDVDPVTGIAPEVLLDGSGAKLVAPAVAVYNLFNFHGEISFASIP